MCLQIGNCHTGLGIGGRGCYFSLFNKYFMFFSFHSTICQDRRAFCVFVMFSNICKNNKHRHIFTTTVISTKSVSSPNNRKNAWGKPFQPYRSWGYQHICISIYISYIYKNTHRSVTNKS